MEMAMRAKEDTDIAQDLTPPISPLSFSLYDSFLLSHCSSCFSLLPPHPTPPFSNNSHCIPTTTLLYCSPHCSSSDSSLHFSSAEHSLLLHSAGGGGDGDGDGDGDSSDLRAALRLLQSQRAATFHADRLAGILVNRNKLLRPDGSDDNADELSEKIRSGAAAFHADRVAGLLVNRDKLLRRDGSDDADEFAEKIRSGARAMAAAIRRHRGWEDSDDDDAVLEEEATVALCVVLTNAVEVQDNSGRTLGIAVYDTTFSWINHSCSPNAWYRFVLSPPNSPPLDSHRHGEMMNLRISPFIRDSPNEQIDGGFYCSDNELSKEGKQSYGPRIIVRSIKRIMKGNEVFVTYTDLLQPKAMRQLELWSRYQFICCCGRCIALPLTHVDCQLQAVSAIGIDSSSSSSNFELLRDKAVRRVTEYIDEVISEYLSVGDPNSCCEKLEYILTQGLNEQLEEDEGHSQSGFKLHPLHYLSLKAYTTLASAYKVHSSYLLSLCSEEDENQLEAFNKSRTSAAYSLLLAKATHHLFRSESSLIASVANFWIGAGESLLSLSRSLGWSKLEKHGLVVPNPPSVGKLECSNCSLVNRFRVCAPNGQVKSSDFETMSSEFLDCVTSISQKVWSFLVCGCHFLRLFKDNIHFSWFVTTNNSRTKDFSAHFSNIDMGFSHESMASSTVVEQGCGELGIECIFQLGVHCIVYGGILASVCYGNNSYLTSHAQNILDHDGNFI